MRWADIAASLQASSTCGQVACIVGGGFTGLACAAGFAQRGYGVLVVDAVGPGSAPASSAAAGLLDPLTTKGRLMWRGAEAFHAASQLLTAVAAARCDKEGVGTPFHSAHGALHVASGANHANVLRASASSLARSADAAWLGLLWVDGDDPPSLVPNAHGTRTDASLLSEAAAAAVECGAHCPHGALYCGCSAVIDTAQYLVQLWAHVQWQTAARWEISRITDTRAMSAAFDHVVIACGAGALTIDETRCLPLDLCRGQVLEYTVAPPSTVTAAAAASATTTAATAAATAAAQEGDASTGGTALCVDDSLELADATPAALPLSGTAWCEPSLGQDSKAKTATKTATQAACWRELLGRLCVAVSGTVYLIPHLQAPSATGAAALLGPGPVLSRLDCGATHETTDDAAQLQGPQLESAKATLTTPLLKLFPPLAAAGLPRCARAGVRAMPPRTAAGSIPLAGLAHTGSATQNVWTVGGMGSRGLLYHALLATWVVEAAVAHDPSTLPSEVRRGCFAEQLTAKLERLCAAQEGGRRRGALRRPQAALAQPNSDALDLT